MAGDGLFPVEAERESGMQSTLWVRLLRQVPAGQLQRLTIVTTIGAEIAIQEIVQMAEEYLILRGRLQGTSDAGRLFLVPLDQVSFVSSQVEMKDDAIRAIFGPGHGAAYVAPSAPPPVAAPALAETAAVHEPAAGSAEEPQPAAAEPAAGETPEQPKPSEKPAGPVNRSELLERLRTRSHNGGVFRPTSGK